MKIVQIREGFVHWDATRDVQNLEYASNHYASNIEFVEAPDYVFEGWSVERGDDGKIKFLQPVPPEGWLYDPNTGTFYEVGSKPFSQSDIHRSLISDAIDSL